MLWFAMELAALLAASLLVGLLVGWLLWARLLKSTGKHHREQVTVLHTQVASLADEGRRGQQRFASVASELDATKLLVQSHTSELTRTREAFRLLQQNAASAESDVVESRRLLAASQTELDGLRKSAQATENNESANAAELQASIQRIAAIEHDTAARVQGLQHTVDELRAQLVEAEQLIQLRTEEHDATTVRMHHLVAALDAASERANEAGVSAAASGKATSTNVVANSGETVTPVVQRDVLALADAWQQRSAALTLETQSMQRELALTQRRLREADQTMAAMRAEFAVIVERVSQNDAAAREATETAFREQLHATLSEQETAHASNLTVQLAERDAALHQLLTQELDSREIEFQQRLAAELEQRDAVHHEQLQRFRESRDVEYNDHLAVQLHDKDASFAAQLSAQLQEREAVLEQRAERQLIARDEAHQQQLAAELRQRDAIHAQQLDELTIALDSRLSALAAEHHMTLDHWRTELAQRQDEVAHRSEELAQRSAELAHRSDELAHLSDELAQRSDQLAHVNAQLADASNQVTQLSTELEHQAAHSARLHDESARLQAEAAQLHEVIQDRDAQLAERALDLRTHQERQNEYTQLLAIHDEDLAQHHETLQQREAQLAELQVQHHELSVNSEQLSSEVLRLTTEAARLEEEVSSAATQLQASELSVNHFESSLLAERELVQVAQAEAHEFRTASEQRRIALDQTQTELQHARADLVRSHGELNELRREIEQNRADFGVQLGTAQTELEEALLNVESAQAELERVSYERHLLEEAHDRANSLAQLSTEELQQGNEILAQLRNNVQESAQEVLVLQERHDAAQAQWQIELAASHQQVAAAHEQVAATQQQLAEREAALHDVQRGAEALESELVLQLEAVNNDLDTSVQRVTAVEVENAQIGADYDRALVALGALLSDLRAADSLVERSLDELVDQQHRSEALATNAAGWQRELEALRRVHERARERERDDAARQLLLSTNAPTGKRSRSSQSVATERDWPASVDQANGTSRLIADGQQHAAVGVESLAHRSGSVEAIATGDELQRIEGIGPKIAAALRAGGIGSFVRLQVASEDQLRDALASAGLTFAPSLRTWAKQAGFLVDNDEVGLLDYQTALIAGREVAR